jgi:hypothetical protein
MKTNMTPSKNGNENSCEVTSQALGGAEALQPYKHACSGFGGYDSINQTPVSKGASTHQTANW